MEKNNSKDSSEVWLYDFVLESVSGEEVDCQIAEQLMENIIEWVEANGFQIGGGCRKPREGESDDIYELRL